MARYSLDILDLLLPLLRNELGPGVNVYSRIPDDLPDYMPLVVVHRTAGRTQYPKFTDKPWISTQVFTGGDDPQRAAGDLMDQVRRVYFESWENATVIDGVGWIVDVRESSGPEELSDPDRPLIGRYQMLHEIRMRHDLRFA